MVPLERPLLRIKKEENWIWFFAPFFLLRNWNDLEKFIRRFSHNDKKICFFISLALILLSHTWNAIKNVAPAFCAKSFSLEFSVREEKKRKVRVHKRELCWWIFADDVVMIGNLFLIFKDFFLLIFMSIKGMKEMWEAVPCDKN